MKKCIATIGSLAALLIAPSAFAGGEGIESEEHKASLTVEALGTDATPECKAEFVAVLEKCGAKKAPQPKRPRTKPTPKPAAAAPAPKPDCEPCKKLKDLEGRVSKLEGNDETQDAAINALRLAIQKTREMIDGLPVDDNTDLQVQINQLTQRLLELEQHIGGRSIQVGLVAGGLYLKSGDNTSYFGAVPAVRFVVPLPGSFSLNATFGIPLSFGNAEDPIGFYSTGTVGYEFATDWTAEAGLGYTGFDIHDQLEARFAFLTGIAGVKYDITKNLDVAAQFHAGREYDLGAPAAAYGGFLGLTLHTNK